MTIRERSRLSNPVVVSTGQVAMTTVFLIGSFILLIVLTLAFISISGVSSNYAVRSGEKAYSVASAGLEDALLRLARNSTANLSYTFNVGSDTANVTIANNGATTGRATITATSVVGSSQRALQAVVSIVTSTGQVSLASWQQI